MWNKVSLNPQLWRNVDLSPRTKERYRTELKLKWLIEYRLEGCTELNLANFKITNIQCILNALLESCPNLTSICLAGWKGLYPEHLMFLVEEFTKLRKLDLSSINVSGRGVRIFEKKTIIKLGFQVEMATSKTAVALTPLCNAIQAMNERLTHLHLADNRLAGIPQLVTALSVNFNL